ncbi:twin-arginine translocase TatA/TatE family subunit [Anaeromyxobacter terrae]|uniref:twin-arginine translocase TatA/TatE family subunit n=1 Tax=Anaeromyxobacter terrae TaxID=2925406 RepID=UPI001F5662E6|nr:twin-arginine translocase TatA/TatE family subunit [Anaeromyxobacter sp. SG22]
MTELLLVLFVTLLVFGATRVPALGDALGRAVRNARGASGAPPARAGEDRRGSDGDARETRRDG